MWALTKFTQKIGGPGKIVEIDESLFFKAKYNVGRRLGVGWIFGGVERGNIGKCFMILVPDRKAETLIPIICEFIEAGTTIISDCWRSYFNVGSEGYTHLTINHSYNFVDADDRSIHTQNVESMWRWAKRKFASTSQSINKRLSRLGEFIYRRIYRDQDIMVKLMEDVRRYHNEN